MEIAVFYAGFGFPEFREASLYLAESAREVYPDCTLTHLTDKYTPELAGFDVIRSEEDIGWEEVISAKGQMISLHARNTEHERTIFCDPDIIFNRPFEWGDWDVGFLYRRGIVHKSFNGGMQFSVRNERSAIFWEEYQKNVAGLCKPALAWWAEQLVMAGMFGIYHEPGVIEVMGAKVGILDMHEVCPKVRELPASRHGSTAVHFAGLNKKHLMGEYFDIERIQGTESAVA
jgi:hypothetical protein